MSRIENDLQRKTENILVRRYALEKIKGFTGKLFAGIIVLTITYLLFWAAGFCIVESKLNANPQIFSRPLNGLPIMYFIIVLIMGGFALWMWNEWKSYLPRFIWIGVLGWFLIVGELTTNMLVPSGWSITEHIFPISNLYGTNPENAVQTGEISFVKNVLTIGILNSNNEHNFQPILFVEVLLLALLLIGLLYSATHSTNKEKYSKIGYIMKYMSLALFIIIEKILCPFEMNVKRYSPSEINFNNRETVIKILVITIGIVILIFYIVSYNFFVFLTGLFLALIFIIFHWEIQNAGRNHKPFSRAYLFSAMSFIFSTTIGYIFVSILLPIIALLREPFGNSSHEFIKLNYLHLNIINWLVIVGSILANILGMVTQFVWDNSRLTDKITK